MQLIVLIKFSEFFVITSIDSEFFYISSVKRFGLARILVERRLFSSGKLETPGTELSGTSCSGTICSAGGGDTTGKEGF